MSRTRGSNSIRVITTNPIPSEAVAIGTGELGMTPRMSSPWFPPRAMRPSPTALAQPDLLAEEGDESGNFGLAITAN